MAIPGAKTGVQKTWIHAFEAMTGMNSVTVSGVTSYSAYFETGLSSRFREFCSVASRMRFRPLSSEHQKMTLAEFLLGTIILVVTAVLLNLWSDRLTSGRPVIPGWVALMRFQSGRRILPPDVEPFGAIMEQPAHSQEKDRSVLVLFPSDGLRRTRRSGNDGRVKS
jgi:hypothetical protein